MSAFRSRLLVGIACCVAAAVIGGMLGLRGARSARDGLAMENKTGLGSGLRAPTLTATSGGSSKLPGSGDRPLAAMIRRERHLANVDPREFPEMVEAELRDETSPDAIRSLTAAWAARDPDGFAEWLRRRPSSSGRDSGLAHTLVVAVARDDPEKAWEMAGELPGSPDWLRMYALSATLRRDPDQALAMVRSHRDAISFSDTGWGFWGQFEPLTTLPLAVELLPGRTRQSMIDDAAGYYFDHPEMIRESKTWFARLTPELQAQARKSSEGREFRRRDPEVWQKLLDAWDEVGESVSNP